MCARKSVYSFCCCVKVVDDQEGTFEAERTLQAKLLPFAPPDVFVLCLHVTEISLSLANAGKVSLPKTRFESLVCL